jgi:hypothetical protein
MAQAAASMSSMTGMQIYQQSERSSPAGGVGQQIYQNSERNRGTSVPRYAAGGQFIATRATPFIAGEGSENELVTITPFSQMRAQNTASFAGAEMGSTSTINLGVTLSSELKAEIINKTLDRVALVVERVRREK